MTWLLDVSVIANSAAPSPQPRAHAWAAAQPRETMFVSVLTLAELDAAIARIEDPALRGRLAEWRRGPLTAWFADRILPIDAAAGVIWAELQAGARTPPPPIDGLLAATALARDLTLVTRRTRDFAGLRARTFDPWAAAAPGL